MITALVSVYYPDTSVRKNIISISKQVDRLIICDNSKESNKDLFCDIHHTVYIANGKNLGLSGAFNSVLEKEDWFTNDEMIIFFDQDSTIGSNYIEMLIEEFNRVREVDHLIGCMGPVFFNTSNERLEVPKMKTLISNGAYYVNNVITSSMISTYERLRNVHFFNPDLFLDLVDWDLCWRMKEHGYTCAITENVVLHHSVGNGEKRFLFIRLRVGAPSREYYQTRDALHLITKGYVPLKMRIRLLANVTIRPILHLIFLDNRRKRLKYIVHGWRDFISGRKGELQ